MVSTTAAGELCSGCSVTWADSAAKFTFATTPGILFRLFSMRAAQAAQVMPSNGKSRRCAEDDSMGGTVECRMVDGGIIYPNRVFVNYPGRVSAQGTRPAPAIALARMTSGREIVTAVFRPPAG